MVNVWVPNLHVVNYSAWFGKTSGGHCPLERMKRMYGTWQDIIYLL